MKEVVQKTQSIKLSSKKIDAKVVDMMITTILQQVKDTDLYKEEQGVIADYEQILHALDSIYKYLYDQQNSHISAQDAQVFAGYVIEKMKDFKLVIDKIKE